MNLEWLQAIASRHALRVSSFAPLTLARHGVNVSFPELCLEVRTPQQRSLLLSLILGSRLGIDYSHIEFDPKDEVPRAPAAFGERLLRLVPQVAVEVAESIAQTTVVQREFLHDSLRIVYLREIGKNLHVLSHENLQKLPYDHAQMHDLARSAFFHEQGSYRPQPRTEKLRHGRIRTYTGSDGLMASRACLMPDFDFDAARESGFMTIPSVDTMLIAEPRTTADREDLRWELLARTLTIWRESKTPFSKIVIDLGMTHTSYTPAHQWSEPETMIAPKCLVTLD